MGICLYLNHKLTFVYLAMCIFWPKCGWSQMPQAWLVQPRWFQWDSFWFAKSTKLQQCRVKEKQLKTQKKAALPKPYTQTLPVHLLQCITNPRTSVRISNWVQHCKPNGYNWPVKEEWLVQETKQEEEVLEDTQLCHLARKATAMCSNEPRARNPAAENAQPSKLQWLFLRTDPQLSTLTQFSHCL